MKDLASVARMLLELAALVALVGIALVGSKAWKEGDGLVVVAAVLAGVAHLGVTARRWFG